MLSGTVVSSGPLFGRKIEFSPKLVVPFNNQNLSTISIGSRVISAIKYSAKDEGHLEISIGNKFLTIGDIISVLEVDSERKWLMGVHLDSKKRGWFPYSSVIPEDDLGNDQRKKESDIKRAFDEKRKQRTITCIAKKISVEDNECGKLSLILPENERTGEVNITAIKNMPIRNPDDHKKRWFRFNSEYSKDEEKNKPRRWRSNTISTLPYTTNNSREPSAISPKLYRKHSSPGPYSNIKSAQQPGLSVKNLNCSPSIVSSLNSVKSFNREIRVSFIKDFIKSEKEYVSDLKIIIESFLNPLKTCLNQKQILSIFGNIEQLEVINIEFLTQLEAVEDINNIDQYISIFRNMVIKKILITTGRTFHVLHALSLESKFYEAIYKCS